MAKTEKGAWKKIKLTRKKVNRSLVWNRVRVSNGTPQPDFSRRSFIQGA